MNALTHKLQAWRDVHPRSHKLFVIGCGRSGTHWLGYTLGGHPQIVVTVEKPSIFGRVTQMAVDPSKKRSLLRLLLWRYRFEHARVAPLLYADKSHPNLWLVEDLAAAFPTALFLGIQRNPYGTVASMLRHRGVRAWCENWEDYPIPNPFLGITIENAGQYADLSLAARCALRWAAHRDRMLEVQALLADRMLFCQYERLILDTARETARLSEFLNLDTPIPTPQVKADSLDKWRGHLTDADVEDIHRVTGLPASC